MDALLIIDFQRTLFLEKPVAHRAAEVAGALSLLAARFRAGGGAVLYLRHADPGTSWDPSAPGWPIHDSVAPEPQDEIVDKRSSDGFRDTTLGAVLARVGVKRLFVGGYATEFCVDTTIRAAASRGIGVTVVADGHTTRDRPFLDAPGIVAHHNWVWANIANPGNPIEVLSSAEILDRGVPL